MELKEAINKLNGEFTSELFKNNLDISPDTVSRLNHSGVNIGIKDENGFVAFNSEISIYKEEKEEFSQQENTMSYSSTSEFTPDNERAFWKTIHAATFIRNWDIVCILVNTYCSKYTELKETYKNGNNS